MEQHIILALDGMHGNEPCELTANLRGQVGMVKVNDLLDRMPIQQIVSYMKGDAYGVAVMSDPKLHDIPNTVYNRMKAHVDAGAKFVTVHIADEENEEMVDAALRAADGSNTTVIGVTHLTSKPAPSAHMIERLANLGFSWGLEGIVCSGQDLSLVQPDRFKYVITPGVRSEGQGHDDQKRVTTPEDAIRHGATHVVVGREITKAEDPFAAAKRINDAIESMKTAA